jgi:hypothetical protein
MRMSTSRRKKAVAAGGALLFALAAALGCKNTDPAQPGASPASTGSAGRKDELFAKFSAMAPSERIQAAMKICYVGRECEDTEARALLEAAATPEEREALKATARSSFLRQYAAFLSEQGKRPDRLTGGEGEDRTLRMTGEACSRFLLENFGGRPGKTAKLIGFYRFECESKALKAGIDL